jgi:hypothetical protein
VLDARIATFCAPAQSCEERGIGASAYANVPSAQPSLRTAPSVSRHPLPRAQLALDPRCSWPTGQVE